jgi:hypothetical protein
MNGRRSGARRRPRRAPGRQSNRSNRKSSQNVTRSSRKGSLRSGKRAAPLPLSELRARVAQHVARVASRPALKPVQYQPKRVRPLKKVPLAPRKLQLQESKQPAINSQRSFTTAGNLKARQLPIKISSAHPTLKRVLYNADRVTGTREDAKAFHESLKRDRSGKAIHRSFLHPNGDVTMVGRDVIGFFTVADSAQPGDKIIDFPINPVSLGFPALTLESQLHDQYYFEEFEVIMPPTVGTMTNGDFIGFYNRDPDQPQPDGEEAIQIGAYKQGKVAVFKEGAKMPLPKFESVPTLYCSQLGDDSRLTEQATYQEQIVTPPYINNGTEADQVDTPTERWCHYRCHFKVSTINESAIGQGLSAVLYSGDTYQETKGDPLNLNNITEFAAVPEFTPFNTFYGLCLGVDGDGNGDFVGVVDGYGADFIPAVQISIYEGDPEAKMASGFSQTLENCVNEVDVSAWSTTHSLVTSMTKVTVPGKKTRKTVSVMWILTQQGWQQFPADAYDFIWRLILTKTTVGTGATDSWYLMVSAMKQAPDLNQLSLSRAGPATVEGLAVERWEKLTKAEKKEFNNNVWHFIRACRRRNAKDVQKDILTDDIEDLVRPEDFDLKQETKAKPPQDPIEMKRLSLLGRIRNRNPLPIQIDEPASPPPTPASTQSTGVVKKQTSKK